MKIKKSEYNNLKENEKHFFDLVKYLYSCISIEPIFAGDEKLEVLVCTKYNFDISIIELYKLIGLDFSNCIVETRVEN